MKRAVIVILVLMMAIPLFAQVLAQQEAQQEAEQEAVEEKVLVIRQAKENRYATAAVEVYLADNILEVTVVALMYANRPKIYNVLVVGPRLGRMSPQERKTLYPKAEDREILFQTTDTDGGVVRFSKKTKKKKLKGTLIKELVKFKIPTEKIVSNKRYQLWVQLESTQSPGQVRRFRFDLKDLPALILK